MVDQATVSIASIPLLNQVPTARHGSTAPRDCHITHFPEADGQRHARVPPYWAGGAGMAVIPETPPAPASEAPRWRRFLTPWRSPADQPRWARPALLAIAAVAAVAYGWEMAGASVEPFYGAAARSMSESWPDFIFGAFDPAGTVTVDKLPGALWGQVLLVAGLRLSHLGAGPAASGRGRAHDQRHAVPGPALIKTRATKCAALRSRSRPSR